MAPGFLRSAAFRISSLFALTVIATTTLVFAVVRERFYAANISYAKAVLTDEIARVIAEPTDRLKAQMALHLTNDLRHLDYGALYNGAARLIVGNLPAGLAVPEDGSVLQVPLPREPWQSAQAVFVSRPRPDGGRLILGRSLEDADRLDEAMMTSFAIALAPIVLVALLVGAVTGTRAFRRLDEIQDAIGRVMSGELAVRLPSRGTPDDVDRLVRAVNRMLDEIGRLVGQLRSVGDNIAHDLRAPLAVTRIRLERGLAGRSEGQLRTLCGEALADLDRAMTTATALLRISDLESGIRRGAFAPVDIGTVASDVFDLFEPLAEAKGITMTLRTAAPNMVSGDGDLLREALANVVDNAVKYTPTGGAISVECGNSGDDLLVRVTDSGPGVAENEREAIFKRFYRSQHSRTSTSGSGLGLSMAATIVDLHGFRLRATDGRNRRGASFEIIRRQIADIASSTK